MGKTTTEDNDDEDHSVPLVVARIASALLKILSQDAADSGRDGPLRPRELPPAMAPETPPKIAARRDIVVYGWPHLPGVIIALALFILAIATATVMVRG
jgi:hypothetical protein